MVKKNDLLLRTLNTILLESHLQNPVKRMKGQKELNVHVMPAENFGRHLSCWKEGGRKACKKDPIFNEMEADMHNLVPATC